VNKVLALRTAQTAVLLVLPVLAVLWNVAMTMNPFEGFGGWEALLSLQALLLLARNRLPLIVTLTAILPAVHLDGWPVVSAVVLYSLARHYGGRWQTWIGYSPHVALPLLSGPQEPTLFQQLYFAVLFAAFCALPLAVGFLVRARKELARRLAELEAAREREHELLAQRIQIVERARMARDMHDVIAHKVAVISVQAAALQATTADDTTRTTARTLRELAASTLGELHRLLGVLRTPVAGEAGSRQPVLADLPHLIGASALPVTFRAPIALSGPDTRPWPAAVHEAVFHIVQEGLTNAAKHAPGADIDVHVDDGQGPLTVTVTHSPPPPGAAHLRLPKGGFGLLGLRERTELAGGRLHARPGPDGSHVLTATFPAPDTSRSPSPP
jgi:signal transduction histidine kinase